MSEVLHLAQRARAAASALGITSTEQRNKALLVMAHALTVKQDEILSANQADMDAARAKGTAEGLLDRLELDSGAVEVHVRGAQGPCAAARSHR